MVSNFFRRLPKHIGIIPDGNRRWAQAQGLTKEKGYSFGLSPGIRLYELCLELGIPELTFYGFTVDNTKRPKVQRDAFRSACVEAVKMLSNRDAALLVVGNTSSGQFPQELLPFTQKRIVFGKGTVKVNFLVNYGWKWDLEHLTKGFNALPSKDISRLDLIIRWGGRRRLSGFLPIQSIYADFYIIDDYWPDFKDEHFYQALSWYQEQDITLGG